MPDSEKGDSSTGEAKAKKSMLDEDFSKDFLSSWKSMSTTGSDDMDFDLEPVNKGKKKTFDFGMDMDFSLDDAFGKMSSFKIDIPDFDFSTSPQKPTKPKEKSKEQDKHDEFLFSFDFDGGPTAGKTMSMKNKDPGHMNSKIPVAQASFDGDRTELSDSENNKEGSTHIDAEDKSCSSFGSSKQNEKNSGDCPSSCNKEREKIKPDSVLEEMEKIPAAHIDAVDNSGHHEKNSDDNTNSCTKDSVLEKSETIVAAHISPRDKKNRNEMSADTLSHNGKEAKDGLPSLKYEKTINNVKSSRDMDFSLDDTFGKISSFKIDMPDVEFSSSPIKTIKPKEKPEEDSGEGNRQDKHDKFSYSLDFNGEATTSKTMLTTNKVLGARNSKFSGAQTKNDSGKTDFSASEDNEEGLTHISSVDKSCSAYGDGKHNEKNSNNACPSSCTKELSKSDSVVEGSNEIAAVHIDGVDRRQIEHLYEEKNSDERTSSCTKGLIKTDPVLEESEKIAAAPIDSADVRYGDSRHTETKSDDSKISCTKDLIKPDPVLEKTEKISIAFTPSRDHDGTVHGKQRNEMIPDSLPQTGKEAKHGLSSLENEKMINNVKSLSSSGFRIPSVSPAEQGNKFGNLGRGKFNNKISGIASIQKLNIGQENKVSAQRIDKKTLALPTLNFTRSSIKGKNLAAPTMQRNAQSPGNVEKSIRLQATIKMVSPVSAEKQTPSTPSLKRKPSEAADMIPAKLHTPKRVSTSESRMSKISAREAQTQGNLLERNRKNVSEEYKSPKFDFSQEANREALQFSMAAENDENVEKAEACSKELDNICNMLKKKHEEAKELLVRALVNNNNLLMLNHPIYEEKICAVQRLASRLMSKELEVEA